VLFEMGHVNTQFSVGVDVKNRLDRYKAQNKEKILEYYDKKKRFVTNTDVIRYLLDGVRAK